MVNNQRKERAMNTILTLFWFGFLICAAIFVFQLVIGIVMTVFALIVAGIASLFGKEL